MKWFTIIALLALTLTGCDSKRLMDENQPIAEGQWFMDSVKTFEFDITDTTNLYNLFLNVRHTNDYPFRNLHVNLKADFPSGKTYSEIVSVILADPYGKWVGSGFGNYRTYQAAFTFKQQTKLPAGHYTMTLEQGMRQDPLPGITDIGIRVERSF